MEKKIVHSLIMKKLTQTSEKQVTVSSMASVSVRPHAYPSFITGRSIGKT